MNKIEQQEKIAEFCGWRIFRPTINQCVLGRKDERHGWSSVPDYLGDLNAIHEAEETLNAQQFREYADMLDEGNGGHFATSSQRAEVLLRTLGKWTNEQTPNAERSQPERLG